jgi:DNA polymerase-3 subunit beta
MKLTILKEKLKKGLYITERASAKSITLPILQNILFVCEKNFLNLNCTDLEIGICWWGLVKVEKEGKILLPLKKISDFLNFLPEKPVLIEKKDDFVLFNCDSFSSKIKTYNPDEFPIIPKIQAPKVINISAQLLTKQIKKIMNFSSFSTTRPEISGIHFSFNRNILKIAATDSFRLGETTLFLPQNSFFEKELSFILPQRAAKEIVNIFSSLDKDLKIYTNPSQLSIETDMEETPHPEILFTSRLIEGEFPDYQAIVPKKFALETVFFKEEFLRQVKAASIFSPKNNEIKLKFNPQKGEVEITSENPEFGSYSSFLKGKIEGKPFTISFNYRFLLEGVEQIEGKEFSLRITNEEGPALIKSAEKEDFFYILMPIRAV